MLGAAKRIVYVLESETDPRRHYVGVTDNIAERMDWHNGGHCGHTVRHRPWFVLVIIEFRTAAAALRFEKYLKSGSGRAFAKRHLG